MSVAAPELSIVIPAYNEEARLPGSLSQIAAYIRGSGRPTEVIVVDDGSTDRTPEIFRKFHPHIRGCGPALFRLQ